MSDTTSGQDYLLLVILTDRTSNLALCKRFKGGCLDNLNNNNLLVSILIISLRNINIVANSFVVNHHISTAFEVEGKQKKPLTHRLRAMVRDKQLSCNREGEYSIFDAEKDAMIQPPHKHRLQRQNVDDLQHS
jgi:hypothetical protein